MASNKQLKPITAEEFLDKEDTGLVEGDLFSIICRYGDVRRQFDAAGEGDNACSYVENALANALCDLERNITQEVFHNLADLGYAIVRKS